MPFCAIFLKQYSCRYSTLGPTEPARIVGPNGGGKLRLLEPGKIFYIIKTKWIVFDIIITKCVGNFIFSYRFNVQEKEN